MILKCSRVATLRTAYPEAFGGLYVAGERPDDVDTGEDAETPATVTREKPALPPLAPREELTFSTAREAVPVKPAEVDGSAGFRLMQTEPAREPGSDDGEVDPMEREVAIIVEGAKVATTQADLDDLKPRAMAFHKGSPEYKRCAAALTEAFGRISRKGAA
jgi:hypothetical protein